MKHSLEVRVPLLDHTLVEFANRAPSHYKLRDGSGKYLLKRMLASHLPGDLLRRPKRGFGIPIRRWFRGSLNGFARETLTGRNARLAGWLNPAAVERVLRDHERGGRDQEPERAREHGAAVVGAQVLVLAEEAEQRPGEGQRGGRGGSRQDR